MVKLAFKSLLEAIADHPDIWGVSFLLGLFQPFFVQIQSGTPLSLFGFTDNFVLFLAPTLVGCLLAVFKSSKPLKERWVIVVFSLLFNGYILESIANFFDLRPNAFGYFLGGASGYYLIEFLFAVLQNLKPKGVPLFYLFLKNKAEAGVSMLENVSEDTFIEADEAFKEDSGEPEPEKPKRNRKPKEEKR